ncbi:zinc ribbon domain-containing protein [Fusobacterium sp. MFO224]|uniref:zinc ribbon domain-containing protein n=1 Tax=Fusobacterium sp. MFO224 TaxID=3378070 RepID=UPI00385338D8
MNLDFKCIKCGNDSYFVETVVLPEKNHKLRLNIGTYYLKICSNCGYTEIYSAKILDNSTEKILDVKPEKTTND